MQSVAPSAIQHQGQVCRFTASGYSAGGRASKDWADLGGNLLKKRIGRPGQGKSGGFRTIVATRDGEQCFFLYGFAKSERSDIEEDEVAALKVWSKALLSMPAFALARAEAAGELIKVDDYA